MQIIKTFLAVAIFLKPMVIHAQGTYIPLGAKDYIVLDRLEIKMKNNTLNFSSIKPFNRKIFSKEVEYIDSLQRDQHASTKKLSRVDKYNIQRFLLNNKEWVKPRAAFISEKPIANTLFKSRANMFEVNEPDFFLAINPMLQFQYGKESNYDLPIFLNTRGAMLRGLIAKKVGFYMSIAENQERTPTYIQNWVNTRRALPGAGYYKPFKNEAYDYLDARGGITFNVAKFIDMQFAYDRNFFGNGYRSLLLSDFATNQVFLKINTRFGKFNYQNLFVELVRQYRFSGGFVAPRKYARINHLSINATKWLSLGMYEGIIFGRQDRFDFQYLIPVMFLRPAEQQAGSGDNALFGLEAKINIAKTMQLYSHVMFDEFDFKQLKIDKSYWAHKFAYQVGLKYIDVFGLKNVDLQLEANRVRPFTYSHFDTIANYTHYNQPLAHPLGANFQEYIAIVKAQPLPKLYLQARMIYYQQGLDSNGVNMGNNPLKDYRTRPRTYGWYIGSGDLAKSFQYTFNASWELKENLFMDFNFTQRKFQQASTNNQQKSQTIISTGLRWNMARREYDWQ